ncbi:MAG: type II toxin-antitoxin system VapB family antitoxin [Candidatus Marinimicrobia bacterium]|nr:type II toxin-antitoxin system VapB family antitoxin [Candidatus Neomarinimicrobiota bacterium]
MRITIDIPDGDLEELMESTKAKTKHEAIVHALRHFNKSQKLRKISEMLGTFEDFMTQNDLNEMRETKSW